MIKLTISAVLIVASCCAAQAATFTYPDKGPALFSITLPDGWKVERLPGKLNATSPEQDMYIGLWGVPDPAGVDVILDLVERLIAQHIPSFRDLDRGEKEFGPVRVTFVDGAGVSSDGNEGRAGYAIFSPDTKSVWLMFYMASRASLERYRVDGGRFLGQDKTPKPSLVEFLPMTPAMQRALEEKRRAGGRFDPRASDDGSELLPGVDPFENYYFATGTKGMPGTRVAGFKKTDRTFFFVGELKSIAMSPVIHFAWHAISPDDRQDILVAEADASAMFGNQVIGSVTLPRDWPPGKYRVDVSVNRRLALSVPFRVE